jgi:hypothetical protein
MCLINKSQVSSRQLYQVALAIVRMAVSDGGRRCRSWEQVVSTGRARLRFLRNLSPGNLLSWQLQLTLTGPVHASMVFIRGADVSEASAARSTRLHHLAVRGPAGCNHIAFQHLDMGSLSAVLCVMFHRRCDIMLAHMYGTYIDEWAEVVCAGAVVVLGRWLRT